MSVAKLSSSGHLNAMKSDDGNDPLTIYIRKAVGRGNSPVHWVHISHPFDQPDLPGWPLLTPYRMQLQKCDKCSREFCSPMNYRRHIRMHRRSLNIDKEYHKNRDSLAAFWDKLSSEDAGRVVSLEDISLEGVPGSLIVNTWSSSLHRPDVLALPQLYLRAGSILLEIIQAKSSRLPISSQELFNILDETSEMTFLCAGTAESVQKFVIDGGAEKALELRNLVASTSLLLEQKLVNAWVAEKNAEALRCQKILVEEEEVAQKRQAQILERKRQKKLRQKEQKVRGQSNGEKTDSNIDSLDSNADFVEGPASAEIPQLAFDHCSDTPTDSSSCLEQINVSIEDYEEFTEAHCDHSINHVGIDSIKFDGFPRVRSTNDFYQSTITKWQVPKSYPRGQVAFSSSQNLQASKLEALQKQGPANETNYVANGGKVWGRKSKIAIDEDSSRTTVQNVVAKTSVDVESLRTTGQNVVAKSAIDVESSGTILQNMVAKVAIDGGNSRTSLQNVVASHMDMNNGKLLIGSMFIPVKNSTAEQHISLGESTASIEECATPGKNNSQKPDSVLNEKDPAVPMSRDACVCEMKGNLPVQRGNQNCGENARLGIVEDHEDQTVTSLQLSFAKPSGSISNNKTSYRARNVQQEGSVFSISAAKAFLAQRWKDAIASDHVKLVLSPEPPFDADGRKDRPLLYQTSDCCHYSELGDTETPVTGVGPHVHSSKKIAKPNSKRRQRKVQPGD